MYQALFLSHGGGPLPLLGDASHTEMVVCLQRIAKTIPRPDAILVISAHWESTVASITASNTPSLLYDYFGFPEESYKITYPCLGHSQLSETIHGLLNHAGIEAALDKERGLDHGVFVPLKIMYPDAGIPCVQLSLLSTLDPLAHIKIGQALQPLKEQNVLVIGSGFSFHNMQAFFAENTSETKKLNHAFEDWLLNTCANTNYSEQERMQRLVDWANALGARFCHPREEHLLPLHVCYGYAQAASTESFSVEILGKKASFYYWSN